MRDARAFEALHGDERLGRVLAQQGAQEADAMDLFHDNPMFPGVRQMLGAFAKQADPPDRDQARPRRVDAVGPDEDGRAASASPRPRSLDGRKKLTGVDEDPRSEEAEAARRGSRVVGSEELA